MSSAWERLAKMETVAGDGSGERGGDGVSSSMVADNTSSGVQKPQQQMPQLMKEEDPGATSTSISSQSSEDPTPSNNTGSSQRPQVKFSTVLNLKHSQSFVNNSSNSGSGNHDSSKPRGSSKRGRRHSIATSSASEATNTLAATKSVKPPPTNTSSSKPVPGMIPNTKNASNSITQTLPWLEASDKWLSPDPVASPPSPNSSSKLKKRTTSTSQRGERTISKESSSDGDPKVAKVRVKSKSKVHRRASISAEELVSSSWHGSPIRIHKKDIAALQNNSSNNSNSNNSNTPPVRKKIVRRRHSTAMGSGAEMSSSGEESGPPMQQQQRRRVGDSSGDEGRSKSKSPSRRGSTRSSSLDGGSTHSTTRLSNSKSHESSGDEVRAKTPSKRGAMTLPSTSLDGGSTHSTTRRSRSKNPDLRKESGTKSLSKRGTRSIPATSLDGSAHSITKRSSKNPESSKESGTKSLSKRGSRSIPATSLDGSMHSVSKRSSSTNRDSGKDMDSKPEAKSGVFAIIKRRSNQQSSGVLEGGSNPKPKRSSSRARSASRSRSNSRTRSTSRTRTPSNNTASQKNAVTRSGSNRRAVGRSRSSENMPVPPIRKGSGHDDNSESNSKLSTSPKRRRPKIKPSSSWNEVASKHSGSVQGSAGNIHYIDTRQGVGKRRMSMGGWTPNPTTPPATFPSNSSMGRRNSMTTTSTTKMGSAPKSILKKTSAFAKEMLSSSEHRFRSECRSTTPVLRRSSSAEDCLPKVPRSDYVAATSGNARNLETHQSDPTKGSIQPSMDISNHKASPRSMKIKMSAMDTKPKIPGRQDAAQEKDENDKKDAPLEIDSSHSSIQSSPPPPPPLPAEANACSPQSPLSKEKGTSVVLPSCDSPGSNSSKSKKKDKKKASSTGDKPPSSNKKGKTPKEKLSVAKKKAPSASSQRKSTLKKKSKSQKTDENKSLSASMASHSSMPSLMDVMDLTETTFDGDFFDDALDTLGSTHRKKMIGMEIVQETTKEEEEDDDQKPPALESTMAEDEQVSNETTALPPTVVITLPSST